MADQIVSRFTRIVTSQKLDDRFLTAQHLSADDDDKKNLGELYIVVEITRPWFPISQIGSRIITTLKKTYYNSDSTSDLVNFEKAIKAINELLLNLTEQGETEWIGHLNAVIALQVNREIHLTSAGDARAYLFREGKVSHITEDSTDKEPHPLKTFGSIVSGTLLPEDGLLLSNPDLLTVSDIATLKNYFEQVTPLQAASEIVKQIKKSKIKTVGAVVIKLLPQSQTIDKDPEVLYIDQALKEKTTAFKDWFVQFLKPLLIAFSVKSQLAFKKAHQTTKEKILPKTKQTTSTLLAKTQERLKVTWSKTQPVINEQTKKISGKIDSTITGIKEKSEPNPLPSDPAESIIGRSIFTINDYQESQAQTELSAPQKIISTLRRYGLFIWLRLIKLRRTLFLPQRRPLLFSLGILILIISLITSIAIQRRSQALQKVSQDQKTALEDAKKNESAGKAALTFGNKGEAQLKFGEAIKLAEPLLSTALSDDAKTVIDQSQIEFDKLTGTSRFNQLTALATVNGNKLVVVNGQGYAISDQGVINQSGLTANSVISKSSSLPSGAGNVTALTTTGQDTILIATQNNRIYEFNPETKDVIELTLADDQKFQSAIALDTFGNSIYVLDKAGDQIWKYTRTDNQLDSKQKFLKTKTDLSEAAGMAIDGSIYVIFSNGSVSKFSRGDKTDFKFSSIPKPFDAINNPIAISTDENNNTIFVLDGGDHRILEFDKNGQFTHQYVLPADFKNLKDFVVQIKGRVAFVINDGKLYEVNL